MIHNFFSIQLQKHFLSTIHVFATHSWRDTQSDTFGFLKQHDGVLLSELRFVCEYTVCVCVGGGG